MTPFEQGRQDALTATRALLTGELDALDGVLGRQSFWQELAEGALYELAYAYACLSVSNALLDAPDSCPTIEQILDDAAGRQAHASLLEMVTEIE